jgi:hypothetical protein
LKDKLKNYDDLLHQYLPKSEIPRMKELLIIEKQDELSRPEQEMEL